MGLWVMGIGCTFCGRQEPRVEVVREEDGSYTALLCGHFTLHPTGDHPFRVRRLMLFLRLLESPGPQRGGRRTRDGRPPFLAQVSPKARHHQCLFHALQEVQEQVKEVYGAGYSETHPEAKALKERIYPIFKAKTQRTAQKRYEEGMALRERYVQETPEVAGLFAFLERHWPTLVNGIESKGIPKTNNAVELVIRRFDQHDQNFWGFESLETARLFLGVFEKVYRFTPFSSDAQPGIRGQCPPELAGYDIRQMPMASLCAGLSIVWPLEAAQNLVPNS